MSVHFADIHRPLSLFVQGLGGKYLHLKPLETGTAGIGAARIAPDGNSIYLPPEIKHFATRRHNLGAYRITALRQLGYLLEGTLDFDLENFLARSPRRGLLARVFATLEDLRIDMAIGNRYPGARADLNRSRAHALSGRPPLSAMRTLPALLEALLQYSLGAPREELQADDSSALLAGLIDAAAVVRQPGANVYDSARASLRICAALEKLLRRPPANRESSEAREAPAELANSESAKLSAIQDLSLDLATDAVMQFRGALNSGSFSIIRSDASGASTAPMQRPRPAEHAQATAPASSCLAPHRQAGISGPQSFLYDEWDYHRQSYLDAWCRVFEHRLRGDDFDFIADVRRRHYALAGQVRRQFGSIRPQAWQRVRRTSDGDELELDSVIQTVIDRRTGNATDAHLYIRRDRARREVAAAFLVDMSASTDFPLPEPGAHGMSAPPAEPQDGGLYLYGPHIEPPGPAAAAKRRVIDVSKDALALMSDALQRLGDNYAVYGFSGDGRENVEFNVIKDFDDKLSAQTWAALASMQPRRSTRMGPAIRHAVAKIAREPANLKLLMIISDGYPEDRDYGPDRTDREYGIQDTARALHEAERDGIVYFCITIDPAGNDYLRRMCRASHYLVIDDVSALPRELSKIYRSLTA
jgi:nitric oxide reductase NorD protein